MVGAAEVMEHGFGLLLVWAAAIVAGRPLARLLPRTCGRMVRGALIPLLGAAYWAAVLFVLPFRGGLWVAGAFAVLANVAAGAPGWPLRRVRRREAGAAAILLLGMAVYLTPLLTQHVPRGMDASRLAMNARLIAAQAGPPRDLSPFAPQIPFGAINHGLPALAAPAVMCGVSAAGAMIAATQFAYACMVLGVFTVVRFFARPLPAAVIAVAACWFARDVQVTFEWGGFSTVLGTAVGLGVAVMLVNTLRQDRWGLSVPLGVSLAALPVIHPLAAGGWLYAAAPIAAVAGLAASRHRIRGLRATVAAACLAGVLLACFYFFARPSLGSGAMTYIREHERAAVRGEGLFPFVAAAAALMPKGLDENLFGLAVAACVFLAARRRWRQLALAAVPGLVVFVVILNSRLRVLPGSSLLYVSRIQYWLVPAAAIALAAAWSSRLRPLRKRRWVGPLAACILLVWAGCRHGEYYQKPAVRRIISDDAWQALLWARDHLAPGDTYVLAQYGTAGAYLPAVAGVATTGWHANLDQLAANAEMRARRPLTHVLMVDLSAIRDPIGLGTYSAFRKEADEILTERGGETVFQSGPVRLLRLNAAAARINP